MDLCGNYMVKESGLEVRNTCAIPPTILLKSSILCIRTGQVVLNVCIFATIFVVASTDLTFVATPTAEFVSPTAAGGESSGFTTVVAFMTASVA